MGEWAALALDIRKGLFLYNHNIKMNQEIRLNVTTNCTVFNLLVMFKYISFHLISH